MALPSLSKYEVPNALDKAFGGLSSAAQTTSAMQKEQMYPKKTIGAGIMTGAGGALAGAELGALWGSAGGPWGAAIGAGVGALSYFLS